MLFAVLYVNFSVNFMFIFNIFLNERPTARYFRLHRIFTHLMRIFSSTGDEDYFDNFLIYLQQHLFRWHLHHEQYLVFILLPLLQIPPKICTFKHV